MTTLSALYKIRVLGIEDVMREMNLSYAGASTALARWQKMGLIMPVRRNMYVVKDLATDAAIADKYEVASKISDSSYVGWHTALEFHGLAHQPFYNAYVGSKSRFKNFSFEQTNFQYCSAPIDPILDNGVITAIGNPYVRVTDLERTIVDCCDKIDRSGGVEELLHSLEGVTLLSEEKLSRYLQMYGKTFLYQKIGFILEISKEHHHVSDMFIEMCRSKGAIHTKLLTNTYESDTYICRWKLYVPSYCLIEKTSDEYELV